MLSDALDECGLRSQVLQQRLPPVVDGSRAFGRAATARFVPSAEDRPEDPYGVAIDFISGLRPGELVVLGTAESNASAFWGELFSAAALGVGVVGVVTDGNLRDTSKIAGLNFPAFSRSRRPIDYRRRMAIADTRQPIDDRWSTDRGWRSRAGGRRRRGRGAARAGARGARGRASASGRRVDRACRTTRRGVAAGGLGPPPHPLGNRAGIDMVNRLTIRLDVMTETCTDRARGMTWDHPRGVDGLRACDALLLDRHGVVGGVGGADHCSPSVTSTSPTSPMTFDLDGHRSSPCSGCRGRWRPAPPRRDPRQSSSLARESVGRSHESYRYRGQPSGRSASTRQRRSARSAPTAIDGGAGLLERRARAGPHGRRALAVQAGRRLQHLRDPAGAARGAARRSRTVRRPLRRRGGSRIHDRARRCRAQLVRRREPDRRGRGLVVAEDTDYRVGCRALRIHELLTTRVPAARCSPTTTSPPSTGARQARPSAGPGSRCRRARGIPNWLSPPRPRSPEPRHSAGRTQRVVGSRAICAPGAARRRTRRRMASSATRSAPSNVPGYARGCWAGRTCSSRSRTWCATRSSPGDVDDAVLDRIERLPDDHLAERVESA